MTARSLTRVVAALLGLDLLLVLVTGSVSLLSPFALGPVGLTGFLARCALLGACIWRLAAGGRRVLALLLLASLTQFQYDGGRINGDGVMYYVYVRSLWKDFDLDLTNEYTHYGLITRSDIAVPTKTGLRRSIFAIGPAVVWTPFFLLGEGVARGQAWLGQDADLSGYGPCHRNAVALGSLLYGFLAVLLIHALLRRHYGDATATAAAILIWWATFLEWYMVQQPTMSHATSAFGAALALWLWERDRVERRPWGFFTLGLALGLAMCLRWQNGVLLVLPAIELVGRLKKEPKALPLLAAGGALVGLGAIVGVFPQMAAWKSLYDEWLLRYPPHGTDFLRLDHPFVLETFFSSRHGLFSWTPVFWAAYLGFVPLWLRRPQIAWPLAIPLSLMTYVNLCSGDWWAGGSYSNRRFDSLLPILAFGLAAAIDWMQRRLQERPQALVACLALPFVCWNLALVEEVRRGFVPRDDTVTFPRLVGGAARAFADAVGSPTTWPASWIFAWRFSRPPSQYDVLVGRYLFYRQNNMSGHIEIGAPGDDAMLGEGWSGVELQQGVASRRVKGRARFFAPLDVPEELAIRFRVICPPGARAVGVLVNGRAAGRIAATPAWAEAQLRVAAPFWQRELNEVVLEADGSDVFVDAIDFARIAGEPGRFRDR